MTRPGPFSAARLLLIDLARGTRISGQQSGYGRSQWLARRDLDALQERKLAALLEFVAAEVPYYRRLAADGLFAPRGRSPREILVGLPIATKSRLRDEPAAYRSARPAGRRFARHTGGSTGTPFAYDADAAALSGQWAALLRVWSWAGYRLGEPMVTVGGGSVAPEGGGGLRQRVYNGLRNNETVAAAALDEAGLVAALAALCAARPVMVYGYPALLHQLALAALAKGLEVPVPRAVITTSEMLFPGQRRTLEQAFGSPVFDQYGCNEVNLVAGECEAHRGWHYAPECCLLEIVDDDGQPVPPGGVGRIVGTSLDNRAMPFLRYDTGDLGSLDTEDCACGRGLPRLRTLEGRSRDLVRTPDGRAIHGVVFNDLMLEFPWVERYQAIQSEAGLLRVILASRNRPTASELAELTSRLQRVTGLAVELALDAPFELTPGRKTRVIISRLEGGDVR